MARSLVEQAAEAADAAAKEAAMWKERVQQQTNKVSEMQQKVWQETCRGECRHAGLVNRGLAVDI